MDAPPSPTAAAAAVVAPPSRLDALPDEIKTLIARQCRLQDEAWKRHCNVTDHSARLWDVSGAWVRFEKSTPKSSVRSLMAVSRGWERIAAPIVYERLGERLKWENPVFKYNILRRRGTLVKAITFEQSDVVEHWAPLAASLPGLPNLEEFSFDAWGATFLEDWNYTEGEPALGDPNLDRYEEVRYAIFDLLQRVKKLVARGDILDDIFAMFARAVPNGASFATEHLLLTGEVVEDFRYFDAISNLMPNLRHLELRVDRVYQQLDADFEPFRRSFADLRHLTMDVCSGAASPQVFHLAQVIGANLETLRLRDRSRCTSAGRALPPFDSVFPRLRLLELNPLQPPSPADGQVLLRSITSERFPVLETLVVDPNRAFGTAGKPTIVGRPDVSIIAPPEVVGKRPLRLLSYERPTAATAEAMRKRSSHMTDDDVRIALVASAAADAHLFAQNGSLRYELQDVVRFLSNRFRAAVRQDDRVALARLAEAARPLALEQRFMEA